MLCLNPIKVFYKINEKTGKKEVSFDNKDNCYPFEMDLPCGKCERCNLELSGQIGR